MKRFLNKEEFEKVLKAVDRVGALMLVIGKDVDFALKEALNEKDEGLLCYRRRAFIRALFACIEGCCFSYRQIILQCLDVSDHQFTEQEILKLKEQEIRQGVVRNRWLSLEESLRIAFEWTPKLSGDSFKADFTGKGYESMQKAKKLRDDLMHPKNVHTLMISKPEFEAVIPAYEWFRQQFHEFNNATRVRK